MKHLRTFDEEGLVRYNPRWCDLGRKTFYSATLMVGMEISGSVTEDGLDLITVLFNTLNGK